jgi:hypothetical protein
MENTIDKVSYKTPYIYKYKLGINAERNSEGKYIVWHRGERKTIEADSVQFFGDLYEGPISKQTFREITRGTKGIVDIEGVFVEDGQKDLCLTYFEWFSRYIENHDLQHSNPVLATTTKHFKYHFISSNADDEEMEFSSKFVFNFKFTDRVVEVPFVRIRAHKDLIYKIALDSFTRYMMYGKDFLDIAKILTGNAVLNWQEPKEQQYTLKDIIEKEHGPKGK